MASGDRQVSVKIKAAFDAAFNSTFQTADERIKGMKNSLQGVKSTVSDMKGFKTTREEIARLTNSLADQKLQFAEVGATRQEAAQKLSAFQKTENAAISQHAEATRIYKERQAAYRAEQGKLDAMPKQSRQQMDIVKSLKRDANAAKIAQDESRTAMMQATRATQNHRRETLEAGTSVEAYTKKQKELKNSLKQTEDQLRRTDERAIKYSESLKKSGVDLSKLDQEEARLNRTLERRQNILAQSQRSSQLRDRARDLRWGAAGNLVMAAGAGYAFAAPLRDAIEFEKAMIRVKAMAGANAQEYKVLKDDARRLGAETVYSALQVAEAQSELATAGFRTNEIIATMPHLLDLASSSMTSLARTAEITSAVMQGFGLDVTEMQRLGDVLTAAYSSSASSLESLGEMLKYVAPVASVVGAKLESVLAASSVLHNNGITGSMAGTTMRAFLLRLSDPPRATRDMLEQMNVKIRDGADNLRDYKDILHDINRALAGVGTAGQASAWKKLAGEESAPGVARLASAEKSGALRLEEKKYLLAPAFNQLGDAMSKMPDAQLQAIGQRFGTLFNKAMSGGGMIMSLSGSLQGLKGNAYDSRLSQIISAMGFSPSAADIKAEELQKGGKGFDAALRELRINPNKALGGEKSSTELTGEIKNALQTRSPAEQMRFIEILFSKTRGGMRDLFQEFTKSGKNKDQLVQALGETMNMQRARKALSTSTAADLENIKGDWSDIMITLGESVIPLLREFTTWFKPISESIAKWIKDNHSWAKAIMVAVAGLVAFNLAVAAIKLSLSGVLDIKRGLGNVFGKERLGRKASKKIWDGAKWGGRILKKGAGGLIRGGKNLIGKGAWALSEGILSLIGIAPKIASVFGMVMNVIRAAGVALLTTPVGWIITSIAVAGYLMWKNWSTVGPIMTKIWDRLVIAFRSLWDEIRRIFRNGWGLIMKFMSWDPVVHLIKTWDKVIDFFRSVYEKVRPYIQAIFPAGEMKVSGPDKDEGPGFLQRMFDSAGKGVGEAGDFMAGLFNSPTKGVNAAAPDLPGTGRAEKQSFVQRNVITVNAEIKVDAGPNAPREVASRIKSEIQTAFRNTPSFDLFDMPMVS